MIIFGYIICVYLVRTCTCRQIIVIQHYRSTIYTVVKPSLTVVIAHFITIYVVTVLHTEGNHLAINKNLIKLINVFQIL